jgi:hypothetical protein
MGVCCKADARMKFLTADQSGSVTSVNRLADRNTGSYFSLIRDLKGFFSEKGTWTKGATMLYIVSYKGGLPDSHE